MTDHVSDFLGGSGGDVAAVDAADLKAVRAFMRNSRPGPTARGISGGMYESMCSPGANVEAVWYRASMLGLLEMLAGKMLTPWTNDGELDDKVIQVAATFPMKKMEVGVIHEGPPFDVAEFLKQIGART